MLIRQYSRRTIDCYLRWIKRFILFNHKRHPTELPLSSIELFLTHLALERNVSPATQAISLNSHPFLYNQFLQKPIELNEFQKSGKSKHIYKKLSAILKIFFCNQANVHFYFAHNILISRKRALPNLIFDSLL